MGPCACLPERVGALNELALRLAVLSILACASACRGAPGSGDPESEPPADGGSLASPSSDGAADAGARSDGDFERPDGEAGAPVGDGGRQFLLPIAPTSTTFMWQGVQTSFVDSQGRTCTGRVTLAVSDHAVCFEAADDTMKCAGFTYATVYGTSFVDAGRAGVDQILLSPTANTATGNAVCVHQVGGAVSCMGDSNAWGQLGSSTSAPLPSWQAWGSERSFSRIATGTWDQICALDPSGRVFCSGTPFEGTAYNAATEPGPQLQTGGPFSTMWIDDSGVLHGDDGAVFRASDGRSSCSVMATGLVCAANAGAGALGLPGTVVTGGAVLATSGPGGAGHSSAWLDANGDAWRSDVSALMGPAVVTPLFTHAGKLLYLVTNLYTSSVCAVANDASLWCVGDNSRGQLGTGDMTALASETMVAPPGAVYVGCE